MLSLLLSMGVAWPCAALITQDVETLASSDAQEVILQPTATGVLSRYQITYDGDADHFGWVIVVKGEVSEGGVYEADANAFDVLRDISQPLVVQPSIDSPAGGGGCQGCGETSMKGGDNLAIDEGFGLDTGVDIVTSGYAGPFVYTVLRADNADGLSSWLDDNGFDLGGTATTLSAYVDEGGYSFVTVTLTPDVAQTPSGGTILPALAILSDADTLHFPARMALTGMAEELRTTVFVIGEHQAQTVAGWGSEIIDEIAAYGQDPNEAYDEALRNLASSPSYGVVYSGEYEGAWLTRFDTLAPRSVHTADPEFEIMVDSSSWQTRIRLDADSAYGAVWFTLPLIGIGWIRRRTV